ncbi:MAG TPA: alkaline phosphatase PhoX, partial [Pseudonocardiaceae bacterium]
MWPHLRPSNCALRRSRSCATAWAKSCWCAAIPRRWRIPACESPPAEPPRPQSGVPRSRGLNFGPVSPNREDTLRVPQGYSHGVVVRWGDPIMPGGLAFDFNNQ